MTSPLNKIFLSLLILLQLAVGAQSVDREGIPDKLNPPKLVNDFAGILSDNNLQSLEEKLVAYNDSTSTQICIVTVKSIGDYSIEDFAVRLGRKWGVGEKDKNNGILITVSKEERKVDIEIGYGLESHITDYDSKHIIDELIVPAFKQSNYYEGLDAATNRIIAQLQGIYKRDNYSQTNNDSIPTWVIIFIIIFIVLFFISAISSGGGSNSGRSSGGGWTWSSGGGTPWIGGGGSSWGGGGSSGSFGGFGGGSFGGGGSSGSW
jgi:uncharacterized protein